MRILAFFLCVLCAPLTARAESVLQFQITEAFVRVPPEPAAHGAAYLVITPSYKTADLVGAECNCAARVELHETQMDGDVAMMRTVESFAVPMGEGLALTPRSGKHLMLMDLKRPLPSPVQLTLLFADGTRWDLEPELRGVAPGRAPASAP